MEKVSFHFYLHKREPPLGARPKARAGLPPQRPVLGIRIQDADCCILFFDFNELVTVDDYRKLQNRSLWGTYAVASGINNCI